MSRVALVVLFAVGCAEVATTFPGDSSPYAQAVNQRPLGPGQWLVIADVNRITTRSTAVGYLYLRAAELCSAGFEIATPTQIAYGGMQGGFIAQLGIQCKVQSCIGRSSWCTAYNGSCFSTQQACELYRTDAVAGCGSQIQAAPECANSWQPCAQHGQTTCAPSGCFWAPPTCWEFERRWGRDGSACQFCQ